MRAALILVIGFVATGCAQKCVSGAQVACACGGGIMGFQVCSSTGDFGPCQGCPADMAGAPQPDLATAIDMSVAPDMSSCRQNCINNNPAPAQKLEDYTLRECGCQANAGAVCTAMCTAECADPTQLMATSACGMCLQTEQAKWTGSPCFVRAALTDCSGDATCARIIQCELACP
jgi:hypothetical protein